MPEEKSKIVRIERVEVLGPEPTDADDALIEPWFHSRREYVEIRRRQTVAEHQKFAIFFEGYGCLRCQGKERPHAGSALCQRCRPWFVRKLDEGMEEHQQERARR
jgi:hypothetical protein